MKVSDFVKTHSKIKHIDFMISIGSDCRPTINMQSNGLRYFSAPIDAIATRSLKSVLHMYENKFADFFSRYEIVYDNKTTTKGFWVEDTINNAFSIHDFMKDMPVDESYRQFKEKIGRRAKRLDDMLKSAKKIVLVADRLETKDELIWFLKEFSKRTGRGMLCNKPYSGTAVIRDYGREHEKTGALIVYTSADSVIQIAAHESVVPVEQLYEYCRISKGTWNRI